MLFPGIYKKIKIFIIPALSSWNSAARPWHPKASRAQLGDGCGKLKASEDGHGGEGQLFVQLPLLQFSELIHLTKHVLKGKYTYITARIQPVQSKYGPEGSE